MHKRAQLHFTRACQPVSHVNNILGAAVQSDSLEVVEERLKGMGIEYDKEHVVENGIRVTQVPASPPAPMC